MHLRACRPHHTVLGFAVSALLALPALAGTPKALDHVPADAQAVVVVPNLGSLLNDINTLNRFMGDQGQPWVMAMTSMVRGMPGIDLEGSMVAVMEFAPGEEKPDVVMLVPVSDFEAFSQGREAQNGVIEFPVAQHKTMYTRDAGNGFAVFGEEPHDVRNFDAAAGHGDEHAKTLGKSGGTIAEGNDIFMFVNLIEMDDHLAEGIREMEAQGDMVEMMGGAEAGASFDQMTAAVRSMAADALSFSMGLSFDEAKGFAVDTGLQFKEGSGTASYLNNEGNAGQYLEHVPAMDYFFAATYDLSGEGVQKFMHEYVDFAKKMDPSGMFANIDTRELINGLKGGVQVMGSPENMMGGLFNNTVYYMEAENPGAYIEAVREMYAGMAESMKQLEQQGIKVKASVDQQPTQINGVDAYGFDFIMDMSQMQQGMGGGAMGGPNPAMAMQMMFGAQGGPSGYIAEAGDGLIATLSRDAKLFAMAASAAGGENTMSGNESIKRTAGMLPEGRVMEMFIGADHLINTAGPMMMMFGLLPEFEPVDPLPPLGMGLTANHGGLLFRTVLPSQTAKGMMEMVPEQVWQDMHGGEEAEDGHDQDHAGDSGMDF